MRVLILALICFMLTSTTAEAFLQNPDSQPPAAEESPEVPVNTLQEDNIALGNLALSNKEYDKAREYFGKVLAIEPDNKEAKMGIVHSFTQNGESMMALEAMNQMAQDDEVKYTEAQAYYDMGIHTESLDAIPEIPQYNLTQQRANYEIPMYKAADELLKGMVTETADSKQLAHNLRHDRAITITPAYSFSIQRLADSFKLDINKMGTTVSQVVDNKKFFLVYNMYIYSSGNFLDSGKLNNVTNEFRLGVQERANKKIEYKVDVGGKFYQFGGVMANTDSWAKYFFNDKFNLKLGFRRNNVEQSYLSAVGFNIDGIFTGRVADNKVYTEYEGKLPKQFYSFGRFGYGAMTGENLQTNQYLEGMVGLGRVMYDHPENKWINLVNLDLVSYNSSYQYNLLNIYNAAGKVFGGYFSPRFFSANTLNLKMEGEIKKWHLTYGVRGFAGEQIALRPDQANVIFGISPYISYIINDHITINAAYNYFKYADVQRDQFMISAIIRGFSSGKK